MRVMAIVELEIETNIPSLALDVADDYLNPPVFNWMNPEYDRKIISIHTIGLTAVTNTGQFTNAANACE